MNAEQANQYVQAEIQRIADAKLRPLIQSVQNTQAAQRQDDADYKKRSDERNNQIEAFAAAIGMVKQELADTQIALQKTVDAAVTRD